MIKKTSNYLEQVCSKHNIDLENLPDDVKQQLDAAMNQSDFDADMFADALERTFTKMKKKRLDTVNTPILRVVVAVLLVVALAIWFFTK